MCEQGTLVTARMHNADAQSEQTGGTNMHMHAAVAAQLPRYVPMYAQYILRTRRCKH